jgi:transcriptional regulator with XRE-family HTH domain
MSLHSKRSLYGKLVDKKYREAFVSSRLAQTIATQVRVLRQKEEMSQKDLARALGTSQNAICRLENPKYGRPNISTLKTVAEYFDVALVVRFAPFSELVDWALNKSPESVDVPCFDDDLGFVERKPIARDQTASLVLAMQGSGTTGGISPIQGAGASRIADMPRTRSSSPNVITLYSVPTQERIHA